MKLFYSLVFTVLFNTFFANLCSETPKPIAQDPAPSNTDEFSYAQLLQIGALGAISGAGIEYITCKAENKYDCSSSILAGLIKGALAATAAPAVLPTDTPLAISFAIGTIPRTLQSLIILIDTEKSQQYPLDSRTKWNGDIFGMRETLLAPHGPPGGPPLS